MTSFITYSLVLLIVYNSKGNISINSNTYKYTYEHFSKLLYVGDKIQYVIAATKNHLLKFSSDNLVTPLEVRKTGPVNDSVLCTRPDLCSMSICTTELSQKDKCRQKSTDVYVKSWTMTDSQLIVCYNVYQGYCETIDFYYNFKSQPQGKGYSIVTYDLNSHSTILHFENKLYTAIEINNQLNYQNLDFYILSIRTLPNFDLLNVEENVFNIFHGVLGKGYDIIFPLEFKGSFHITDNRQNAVVPNYIFFLINQPENKADPKNGKFQVRLARICSKDDDFSSFMDIGLNCGEPDIQTYYQIESWHLAKVGKSLSDWYRKNTRYPSLSADQKANFDQILFVNFKVIKMTANYLDTLSKFVTCAYPMAELMEVLDVLKTNCQSGDGTINERPYDIHSAEKFCLKELFPDTLKGYCDIKARNKHIIGDHYGENSGKGHEIIKKEGLRASSLFVFPVYGKDTMALIGGSNGYMYKYELFENRFKELANEKLFDSEILDIKFADNKSTAFAISESKMAVINFSNCDKVTVCDTCLHLSPFCGWCLSNGRCSTKDQCKLSLWIGYERDVSINMCPEITNLTSHNILEYTVNKSPDLEFQIIKIPDGILKDNANRLHCQYYSSEGALIKTVTASSTGNSFIACKSILHRDIPPIPNDANFVSIKLKVFIDDSFLVESPFYIFDCSRSRTCSKCTENRFDCSWCIIDNICVATISFKCIQGPIIESKKSSECPKLEFLSKTVAFPAGFPIEIDLKVNNFNVYQGMQIEFLCQESCENSTVKASSSPDSLKCHFKNMQTLSKKVMQCSVYVMWKLPNSNSGYLENTNAISFRIFNCTSLSDHCDDCLFLPREYQCGYCIKTNKCVIESECKQKNDNRWINRRDQYCPSPIINEIIPANSTLTSESIILVKGRNLGFDKIDLQTSISLENNANVIKCNFIEELYISSKQFQCRITKTMDYFETPVTFEFVYRSSRSSHLAKKEFHFYTPSVTKMDPDCGPFMGGTIINVIGKYLNVGSKRSIFLINQNIKTECEIFKNLDIMISCRLNDFKNTPPILRRKRSTDDSNIKAYISFTVDAKTFIYSEVSYRFYQNPSGIQISRDRFLPNGGQMVNITGVNIHIINRPYISFQCKGNETILTICQHHTKKLVCITPKIEYLSILTECELRLYMEKTVLLYNSTVKVYPMPQFNPMVKKMSLPSTSWSFMDKKTKEENLIKFKFVTKDEIHFLAFESKELNISIGNLNCHHVVVSSQFIECNLFHREVDVYQQYEVTINIGTNYQTSLGQIQFVKGDISLDKITLVIIVVLIIIVLVVIIISSVSIVKKIQRNHRKKNQKRDIFTERIEQDANEMLKKGLAELNVATIQNDVNRNLLPMYPYYIYILYNLFPNTHPRVFKDSKNYSESILNIDNYLYDCNDPTSHPLIFNKPIQVIEHTVEYSRKLSKLFEDELFVLILFSFLEEDDVLDSKKSDIVSLLSLILMQDMANYSRILKILIKDDFDKKKENEEEKAMFRQSGLLSKLLSNWFIILMYDHFQKDNPGGDLLTLYFIILNVINSGPVDYATHQSQYALSENSLLKGKVTFDKLKINVIFPESLRFIDELHDSKINISILNCDTVPQVKWKILEEICKYIPYSQWCRLEDLELGKLCLEDEVSFDDEKVRLLQPKALKEINIHTNSYYTMTDHGINENDTLQLFFKQGSVSRSNSASRIQSFHIESNNASMKGLNLVNKIDTKLSQELFKPPRHVLIDSMSTKSEKTKISCCKKKIIENTSNTKDINSCCLIFTQVLKKRLETNIKLLFDDILDQDSVPHCVKDLFSYFNTICKDDKTLFSFKSNSLILRFWTHFITNIDFLFDVPLADNIPVLECLKCIGRILMDVCSECQNNDVWLTQLFSDIIKEYSPKVIRYYESVNLPDEDNSEYYGSIGIDGINISLAIVILYKNYIKPIHDKFIDAIRKSNKPIAKQNAWITILKEVNNLYSPEVFFSNGNGDIRTTPC